MKYIWIILLLSHEIFPIARKVWSKTAGFSCSRQSNKQLNSPSLVQCWRSTSATKLIIMAYMHWKGITIWPLVDIRVPFPNRFKNANDRYYNLLTETLPDFDISATSCKREAVVSGLEPFCWRWFVICDSNVGRLAMTSSSVSKNSSTLFI